MQINKRRVGSESESCKVCLHSPSCSRFTWVIAFLVVRDALLRPPVLLVGGIVPAALVMVMNRLIHVVPLVAPASAATARRRVCTTVLGATVIPD